MDTHLQLVHPARAACVGSANTAGDYQPRVFTAPAVERLGRANHAWRELRNLGLRVPRITWTKQGPLLRIERDPDASLASLLDRMGPRSFRACDGCTEVSGEFEGVTVYWVEASAATGVDNTASEGR